MKKLLATVVVVMLAAVISLGSVFASDPVTMDFVKGATTDNTEGPNGFFGPYDDGESVKLDANDGLTIDMSVTEAWVTAEISPQEVGMYKYAVVVAKADDVASVTGFTIKFGNVGLRWEDWTSVDGKVPMITTDYQTYVFDLKNTKDEKGKTPGSKDGSTIVTSGPEFALNQGEAKGGHVYVKSVTFTDEVPSDYAKAGGNTKADDNKNTNDTKNNNSNNVLKDNKSANTTKATTKTGAETGVEGIAIAVAACSLALAGLVVSTKKMK